MVDGGKNERRKYIVQSTCRTSQGYHIILNISINLVHWCNFRLHSFVLITREMCEGDTIRLEVLVIPSRCCIGREIFSWVLYVATAIQLHCMNIIAEVLLLPSLMHSPSD